MSSPSAQAGAIPERSQDERLRALAQANKVRRLRADLKRDLKQVSITPLIQDPPDYLAAARVTELLAALPGFGRVKAARIAEHCRVNHRKTCAGLSDRQRRELIAALEE